MTTINGPIGSEPLKKPEDNSQTNQTEKAEQQQPNSIYDPEAAKKLKELAAQDGNTGEVSLDEAGQKTIYEKLQEAAKRLPDTAKNIVTTFLEQYENLKYIVQPKMTDDEANAVLNKIKENTTAMMETLSKVYASLARAGSVADLGDPKTSDIPKTDGNQLE